MTEVPNVTFGRTGLAGKHDPLGSLRSPRFFSREKEEGGGGGKADDESDDDMEDSSDDDEEEDEEDEDDSSDDSKAAIKRRDGKPATQKDFDALQEALRKERAKNRKRRGADDKGDDDAGDATEKAAKAEREKWKPLVVRQAATSALSDAGLVLPDDADDRRRALKRALRLLDLSDVDVDDDGDVDGLDDAIADLKDDMPELFTRKRSTGGKINGADRKDRTEGKAKSASEIQAAGLLGKGR